jgi:hypothetical protein
MHPMRTGTAMLSHANLVHWQIQQAIMDNSCTRTVLANAFIRGNAATEHSAGEVFSTA